MVDGWSWERPGEYGAEASVQWTWGQQCTWILVFLSLLRLAW